MTPLPAYEPRFGQLENVRGAEFLPFALYSLTEQPTTVLADLAKTLEGDAVVNAGQTAIHLVKPASALNALQRSLKSTLDHHLAYCVANKFALEYFPFAFLVMQDQESDVNGVTLVHVDFEEPFAVTSFRLKVEDVASCCASLRDDDVPAEEQRETYAID